MAELIRIEQNKLHPTLAALSDAGATTEDADWIRKPGNADMLVRFIRDTQGAQSVKGSETVYTLTIDRAMSLTDMIAQGKYDWVNDDITVERFPLERTDGEIGTEDRDVILVHLGEYLTTNQVKAELDRRGLKPASIVKLLALGTAHPDLQREFPVVALGSSWRGPGGYLYSPFLDRNARGRNLSLRWYEPGDEWREDWRFLAVRK